MSGAAGTAAHRGQFVLTEDASRLPEGWDRYARAGWSLGTCRLPVADVLDRSGRPIGWCLGHPIEDGVLSAGPIRLHTEDRRRIDWPAVDELYERLAGRFLLVLLPDDEPTVLLDAYGSLAAVHSADRRALASVPTLLGGERDHRLAEATGFPHRATWFPFGLTLTVGVRRLQANHSLDLRTWETRRRWLPPAGARDGDVPEIVASVHAGLRRTIGAVAQVHPIAMSLTGGRDSRALLAAARDSLRDAEFFTLRTGAVDEHLAVRLARHHGLRHVVLPAVPTEDADLEAWLDTTGHAIGGQLWRAHGSLRALNPYRVLLPGTAGEVGRARISRPGDPEDGVPTPELLLDRLRVPHVDPFLDGAAAWLAALPGDLSFGSALDLGYIEQRLSCWAGPGHYGNQTSLFELAPYSSRPLFRRMLSLPRAYRMDERLGADLLASAWPELLGLPFNRYPGLRGVRDSAVRGLKGRVRRRFPSRTGSHR